MSSLQDPVELPEWPSLEALKEIMENDEENNN